MCTFYWPSNTCYLLIYTKIVEWSRPSNNLEIISSINELGIYTNDKLI